MSRLRRVSSLLLVGAGLLLLGDVLVTLVWQEPVTALVSLVKREGIDRRYLNPDAMPLSAGERASLARLTSVDERIAFLARSEERDAPEGAAIGRLEIPGIGVSYDVVQGTSAADLELGPGHYRSTALPGLGETVAIAGHRTTYLAPFRNIGSLRAGAGIILEMPYATFDYVVQSARVVAPDAWWITRDVGQERLVLSACAPLYSASHRVVVFARLRSVHPTRETLDGA